MATVVNLRKTPGVLIPEDPESIEALQALPNGTVIKAEYTQPRNYRFLKKYMALIRFAYENWEPEIDGSLPNAVKSFTTFRRELQVRAGYYQIEYSLIEDQIVLTATSISFGQMDEREFNEVFRAVKDVIWQLIFSQKSQYTEEAFENICQELLSYD